MNFLMQLINYPLFGCLLNFLYPYCDYLKENALNYLNKFDKNCSYTNLINIFDSFYSDFLITMFNIGSGEFVLDNNMLS